MHNLYPELQDPSAKAMIILIGTPGTKAMANYGYGTVRRLYVNALEQMFAIVGNKVLSIATDFTATIVGELNTNSGYVSIAENAFQMIMVDGVNGYIYYFTPQQSKTDSNGNSYTPAQFQQITNEGYFPGTSVICLNGFFLQNKIQSSDFIFSAFQDGLTWDPLWFYNSEGSADFLKAIATVNNEAWLFGKLATSIWYCTGGSTTDPQDLFARVQNAYFNIGCQAMGSVATQNNTVFWLGSSPDGQNIVWSASNYLPQRISTHAIEYMIGKIKDTSDAWAFTYEQEGHEFYVLTFPSGHKTFVYDMATNLWHERGTWDAATGRNDYWRPYTCALWNGKTYVGDSVTGLVWLLDLDTYVDNQNTYSLPVIPIKRVRTGGHIHDDRQRLLFHSFELDFQRGVGNQNDDSNSVQTTHGITTAVSLCANPQVCLQWSDDGGFTWSNEQWKGAGKAGEYLKRAVFYRLGMSRDRIFRVKMSDAVKWIIIAARASIEKVGSL